MILHDSGPSMRDFPVPALLFALALLTAAPAAALESDSDITPVPGLSGTAADILEAAPADPFAEALEKALAAADAPEPDLEAISEFYAERDHEPLWIADGALTDAAREAIAFIHDADAWGLDASDYDTPYPKLGEGAAAGPAALARAEASLTLAALHYAGDAQGGRVLPPRLGRFISAQPDWPEAAEVLDALAKADDPAELLAGYHPSHRGFHALRAQLAELREETPDETQVFVAEGATLKPGMHDIRVPDLRQRLDVETGEGEDAEHYGEELRAAVETFQERSGLEVDGIVGNQTLVALNAALDATPADVIANMERWRWLPRDMGDHHVWVNIPEFRLRIVTDGKTGFETRVIVGSRQNQTPLFSDEIEYVDVNPYWNVPRSIAVNEMLPAARQDPNYFQRRGIQVLYNHQGRTVTLDPASIDWWRWNASNMPFRFRQRPGEANALGRVKFMFPNEHAVYLHDTPTRHLFERSTRALSHGCVRVENPVAFADALLAFEDEINGERIKQLIGGQNGSLQMKRHVPVHLTYFTLWVDGTGELQRRPDIYGHDAPLKSALGLTGQTRAAGLALDGEIVP